MFKSLLILTLFISTLTTFGQEEQKILMTDKGQLKPYKEITFLKSSFMLVIDNYKDTLYLYRTFRTARITSSRLGSHSSSSTGEYAAGVSAVLIFSIGASRKSKAWDWT